MSSKVTGNSEKGLSKRLVSGDVPKTETCVKVKESSIQLKHFLQQWNKLQVSGFAILNSIKTLKLDSIRNREEVYPAGLQERCKELQLVIDKMESCVGDLAVLVQQVNALTELNALQKGNNIVGISWSMERFRGALQEVADSYSKELSLKIAIKEEIAHCSKKESIVYLVMSWALQPLIDTTCQLLCESIFLETDSR